MSNFFTAKISRPAIPIAPVQQHKSQQLNQVAHKLDVKFNSAITINDTSSQLRIVRPTELPTLIPIELTKTVEIVEKKEEVILINDDDDDNSVESKIVKASNDQSMAVTCIQEEVAIQSGLNSKRQAPLGVGDIVPEVADVHKKQKGDDYEVIITSAKSSVEQVLPHQVQLTPYAPIRGTQPGLTPVVAIDCEMVVTEGYNHELARCSIVNYDGHVLFDKLILPKGRITNYVTFVSGITPNMMKTAKPYSAYKNEILGILKDRIIVGHSLKNDYDVLNFYPDKKYTRDLAFYKAFKKKGGIVSLKKMTAEYLKMHIQEGQHNSVEDARASMALYRMVDKEWEKEVRDMYYGAVRTIKAGDLKKAKTTIL